MEKYYDLVNEIKIEGLTPEQQIMNKEYPVKIIHGIPVEIISDISLLHTGVTDEILSQVMYTDIIEIIINKMPESEVSNEVLMYSAIGKFIKNHPIYSASVTISYFDSNNSAKSLSQLKSEFTLICEMLLKNCSRNLITEYIYAKHTKNRDSALSLDAILDKFHDIILDKFYSFTSEFRKIDDKLLLNNNNDKTQLEIISILNKHVKNPKPSDVVDADIIFSDVLVGKYYYSIYQEIKLLEIQFIDALNEEFPQDLYNVIKEFYDELFCIYNITDIVMSKDKIFVENYRDILNGKSSDDCIVKQNKIMTTYLFPFGISS